MFELEVGTKVLSSEELPGEVIQALSTSGAGLVAFSPTPWEEHCTECAMPACYSTCDLYVMRRDGKCRRFLNGIEIVPVRGHPQGYVAKVVFKRWGVLLAYASPRMLPLADGTALEQRVRRVEAVAAALPGGAISIAGRRGIPTRLTRRWKQKQKATSGDPVEGLPDGFLVEVYNPSTVTVKLSLTIADPARLDRPPFQRLLEVAPGLHSIDTPFDAIAARVDWGPELHVTLDPNILRKEDEGLTLFFGLAAFVRRQPTVLPPVSGDVSASTSQVKHVKVAVWDLDNTLWSGTLIEDGLAGLTLRPEALAAVRELDRRGIVNSILSKNHADEAMAALSHFGVADLFVFPKVGWGEKGAYMQSLVKDFNVGADTFAFIDDQAFERDQVIAANPGVRAYDSSDPAVILRSPEFNPPQSGESATRRQFYRSEESRVRESQQFSGEYLDFLRTCEMRADIMPARGASFDRIQELVQRTNQLNYSGAKYAREEIEALLSDPAHEAFVVSCTDNYGQYGTVGFVLVNRAEVCLRDAMFSCRIQFKHVEHAMLSFLLERYRETGAAAFHARFCETKKNAAAASVFADMGFVEVSRQGVVRMYRFSFEAPTPNEAIVSITYDGRPWLPSET